MNALIREFANDPGVRLAAVLVLLDFVLGVAAAFKLETFRFGWLSDFLRADVLAKLVPYFAVWIAVRLGGDVELGGIGLIEEIVGVTVIAALGASILNSLRDLGFAGMSGLPDVLAGSDQVQPTPTTPVKG